MMRGMGNMPLWDNLLTFQMCLNTIRSCRMWNFLWDNFPRHHLVGRSSEAKQSSVAIVAGISFGRKQMKSKAFWLLGLVAIAAMALAACGGAEEAPAAPAPAAPTAAAAAPAAPAPAAPQAVAPAPAPVQPTPAPAIPTEQSAVTITVVFDNVGTPQFRNVKGTWPDVLFHGFFGFQEPLLGWEPTYDDQGNPIRSVGAFNTGLHQLLLRCSRLLHPQFRRSSRR